MRSLSVAAALLVVILHGTVLRSRTGVDQPLEPRQDGEVLTHRLRHVQQYNTSNSTIWTAAVAKKWRLMSVDELEDDADDQDDVDNANCSQPFARNDSCQFVLANCSKDVQLINYLAIVACHLSAVKVSSYIALVKEAGLVIVTFPLQPLAYIILALWLVYLISLLATTVSSCSLLHFW